MSKTKINDPGAHHAGSGALIRRFLPYLAKRKSLMVLPKAPLQGKLSNGVRLRGCRKDSLK